MKVRSDHRSKFSNLSNCKEEAWGFFFTISLHCTGRYELNKLTSLPMCGFIAQLVEHRTGIAKVMGSNPVEALILFRLLLYNCLNWKIYCDDHSSLSSLFTRMLCGFLPECIALSTRVHCATNNTRLWHCYDGVFFSRGLQLGQVSGYGLLWFTCKMMWARSCLAFTTLAVVVNAEFESLEIWTINIVTS